MPSYDVGKRRVVQWIKRNYRSGSSILDVGACDGKWAKLLPDYTMDAVEIWKPSCTVIRPLYRNVFCKDISEFNYNFYDLVIFGDVIEHMTVDKAKQVIMYAYERCRDMIVSVPFLYPQGEVDGNPWQAHLQPDLTAEIFAKRYPQLEVLHDTGKNYCYYHKRNA